MTANVPAERAPAPKPQIMAGGAVAALVPQSLDEAFRVAHAIAASGLAPRGLDKPEQVMVAIMAGAELGLAPFQALQSFAIVNNRPTLWGDGLMAVARAQGIKARETLEGEGEAMVATCAVTRPDTGEIIERSFTVADAKKAGLWNKAGPWQQYPRRMLQMRARAWALRDGCADMLRGFQVREEVEDFQAVRDVTPRQGPGLAARLAAPTADAPSEGFNAVHSSGALGDDEIPNFDAAPPVSDGPVPDAEAAATTPSGAGGDDGFPGDREPTGAGETVGPAEPNGDEGTGPAVDGPSTAEIASDWQAAVVAALPDMTAQEIADFLAKPDEQAAFARLEEHQPQLALELNKAITRRRKEIAQ